MNQEDTEGTEGKTSIHLNLGAASAERFCPPCPPCLLGSLCVLGVLAVLSWIWVGAAQRAAPTGDAVLMGKVTYRGRLEEAKPVAMNADPNCLRFHPEPAPMQEIQVDAQGGLRDVFVWIKEGLGDRTFDPPRERAVLDQKECVYRPLVLGVQTGQQIRILNSDPTLHNVHPLPRFNREWNLSQPPGGPPLVKSFSRQEVMIVVRCNIHPWMKAYIGVVSHPFFAVTSPDGTFEIKGLPPGQYGMEAWHAKLGRLEQSVTLQEGEKKVLEFLFQPTDSGKRDLSGLPASTPGYWG